MSKRELERRIDDEGQVHYEPAAVMDCTTLCGHLAPNQETELPVNCNGCLGLVELVRNAKWPKGSPNV